MGLILRSKNIAGVGAFGELYLDGKLIARSVEREWLNNAKNVSCIPAGEYALVWKESPKFGRRIHLVNKMLGVSINGDTQRTHCMIHPANFPHSVSGCIGLGDGWLMEWGVGNSRKTVKMIEDLVDSRPDLDTLTIERF